MKFKAVHHLYHLWKYSCQIICYCALNRLKERAVLWCEISNMETHIVAVKPQLKGQLMHVLECSVSVPSRNRQVLYLYLRLSDNHYYTIPLLQPTTDRVTPHHWVWLRLGIQWYRLGNLHIANQCIMCLSKNRPPLPADAGA